MTQTAAGSSEGGFGSTGLEMDRGSETYTEGPVSVCIRKLLQSSSAEGRKDGPRLVPVTARAQLSALHLVAASTAGTALSSSPKMSLMLEGARRRANESMLMSIRKLVQESLSLLQHNQGKKQNAE